MQYITVILNMFITILLIRLSSVPDRDTFFNPFVSFTNSRINRLIEFLKPALALPEKAVTVIILIFIFLFKSLFLSRMQVPLSINFGEVFRVLPSTNLPGQISLLYFSLLNTVSFILKFWSFYFIVSLIRPAGRNTRSSQALEYYARPFSKPPFRFQIALLAISHIALAFIAIHTGKLVSVSIGAQMIENPSNPIAGAPLAIRIIKTAWIGLLSASEGISVMISVLFAFIIGSLITSIMQRMDLAMLCREGMDMILGRFSRGRSIQTGLDFTPLIFFFAASISYNAVNYLIYSLVATDFKLPF